MENLPEVTALSNIIRKKALEKLQEEYTNARKNLFEGLFKTLTVNLKENDSMYLGNYFPDKINAILDDLNYDKYYGLNIHTILLSRLELIEHEEAKRITDKINEVAEYINDRD